jgi:Tfp pilus assembly protein PilO
MRLPLRRVFEEKRRVTVPVLGGLVLNLALFAGVVLPLSARTRAAESQTRTATQQLQAAEREDNEAQNTAQRRDRTNTALKSFYKDVLPLNQTQARGATFLRMSQLAEQHNLEQLGRKSDVQVDKNSSLARVRISTSLRGEYDDIRHFIYEIESGTDFIVIDSIALRQGVEPGSPLTLELKLSTYYRRGPDGV